MPAVTVEALLESGAHFGHLTRRWNPKMRNFIFMERNGIHIIDLRKTQLLIDIAREAAFDIASQGRGVLFVGTKNQARTSIQAESVRSNSNYVSERWLGGMLTNFATIRKSIKRLNAIDKMEIDGTFEKITKKERLMLSRERERLRRVFGGIEDMTRIPGLLFVVDTKREHLAVKEAKILGIPVIGIVDTNSDPEEVDYPIPANDDSIHSIEIIAKIIADAILEGKEIAKTKAADLAAAGEQMSKETEGEDGKVRRQLRGRRKPEATEAKPDAPQATA
ncbi:MAG: 30S ribosomal protein S2 [Bradyrhizobiaceae bacterium]|nr:30S ribosomal protein S2 [Bradyrhizobiaceae bacterium]